MAFSEEWGLEKYVGDFLFLLPTRIKKKPFLQLENLSSNDSHPFLLLLLHQSLMVLSPLESGTKTHFVFRLNFSREGVSGGFF